MNWLLKRARVTDGAPLTDIMISGGRIAAIAPALPLPANHERQDLDGRIVLPGLVDLHTHLDKTYSGLENQSGTLAEAVAIWREHRVTRPTAAIRDGASRALRQAIANGVTALRSHIDISPEDDLRPLPALLELKEAFRGQIDIQLVALGHASGAEPWRQALKKALAAGVDFVGGAPALCPDPHQEIDAIFALADEWDRPVDLHIDETEDPAMLTLEYLAEQTIQRGWQGRVTAGHCCSLAFVDDERAARVMDNVAAAGIHIVTLPSCNLVLMGRGRHPAPRGTTRVKELLARGSPVSAASDNVRDSFNPFGNYDLLQIANLNAQVAHMSGRDELYRCLDMVTIHPATAFYGQERRLAPGQPADLVILEAESLLEAVVAPPPRLATFKAGRPLVQTDIRRSWYGSDHP